MNSRHIIHKVKTELGDSKISTFIMVVSAALFAGLMVLFFPTIREIGPQFEMYVESLPPELAATFGIGQSDFSSFEVYISSEYLNLFWMFLLFPFLVVWGSNLAKEAANGTTGLVMSYGVSRISLAVAGVMLTIIRSLFAALVLIGTVLLFAQFIDVQLIYANWVKMGVAAFLLCLCVSSITLFFSAWLRSPGKVAALMTGFLLFSYFISVLTALVEEIESLKYFSIFHYYGMPEEILLDGNVEPVNVLVLLVLSVGMYILTLRLFSKSELPVG